MFFVIIIIIIDITIIVIVFLLSSGKDDNLCRLAEFKWYHLIESLSRRSKQNVALFIFLFLIARAVSDQFTFCLRLQSVNNGDSALTKGIVGTGAGWDGGPLDRVRPGASRIRLTKTPPDKPLRQLFERKEWDWAPKDRRAQAFLSRL